MFWRVLIGVLLMNLISCSTYQIAEKHLDGRMRHADLELFCEVIDSGDQIEYWDSKDTTKPAILLVHGFGASTKYQWYKQVELLSRKYRVIAPNLNYFGRTVPGMANFSVGGQVKMLELLLEHLGLDSLTLFGVSYGGLVSVELAATTHRKIQEMVLFDTPVKFADSSDVVAVKEYFDAPSIEELFVPSEPAGLNKLLYLATGKKREIPALFLDEFYEKSYAYNVSDKRQLIKGLLSEMKMFRKREYHFDMPILLVWGSEDRVVPLRTGERLCEYLGENAKLKVIAGAAHMPNMTHKKEFNAILEVRLGITDR